MLNECDAKVRPNDEEQPMNEVIFGNRCRRGLEVGIIERMRKSLES